MRWEVALLPLLLCACRASGLSVWQHLAGAGWGGADGYRKGVSVTGRVFVTMFGYPRNCQRRGVSHACTLSFACWLAGGSSQTGCGASPWVVACCVTSRGAATHLNAQKLDRDYEDVGDDVEMEMVMPMRVETRESPPVIQKRNDLILTEECGVSSDRILKKRIIGGKEAGFGQFPWQAYIKIASYQCGGVLVSRRFVATAAHCIINARLKEILVYLGELDTQDTGKVEELAPAELHRVRRKIIHPNFRYRATQPDRYDLALLELVTEAGYAFHISPICLPDPNTKLTGRNAVVAGWGKVQPSNELMGTNVLRSATVPILDIKECMAWHGLREISVELHDEMLCAGLESGMKDACLGDSGGPLIVLERGRWTLVGITSAGFGCGEPHQPGIYHKVPVTTGWIRSVPTSPAHQSALCRSAVPLCSVSVVPLSPRRPTLTLVPLQIPRNLAPRRNLAGRRRVPPKQMTGEKTEFLRGRLRSGSQSAAGRGLIARDHHGQP